MASRAVIGIQWGDEGKGKIIDLLAESADVVVRCQGGNNAGHTVVVGGDRFVLNLIPCGVLHARPMNVIGNGVVVDPVHLVQEIESLERKGIEIEGRLMISSRAHLILPLHRHLDRFAEQRSGDQRIGTTGRGIGPAYADKAARIGIRAGDTRRPDLLVTRVRTMLALRKPLLESSAAVSGVSEDEVCELLHAFGERFAAFIGDTGSYVRAACREGKQVLFEGAQGTMLDLDAGTYPYVTSSNTTVTGICAGASIAPRDLDRVTGIAKAYATRVGEGPFPSGLEGEMEARLREAGNEYGATTGRPRRCGWFDAVAARYAVEINGLDDVILTNLDVLTGFDPIQIAVAYTVGGAPLDRFPAELPDLSGVRPVHETMPGWREDITRIRRYGELPASTRNYVEYLEGLLNVPISRLSVGPERSQMIDR